MNSNHNNSWSSYLRNGGIPPCIQNQQNISYFENASNNPNSRHNLIFQNHAFIPNPHIRHYPYHSSPYPYHYQHFLSQSTSLTMSHGIQKDNSGVQLNSQEIRTPQPCTQWWKANYILGSG